MSDSVGPHIWQPTRLPPPWDSPGKNTGVGCHFLLQCRKVKSEREVAQSCPTLSNPMDCSLPGSSVPGNFQARVLEWGAIAFSVATPECILRHEDLFKMILFFNSFLILAVVGLCCCTRAFSGCGERGPRSSYSPRASPCGGFSCCRAWAPGTWASVLRLSGSRAWVQ